MTNGNQFDWTGLGSIATGLMNSITQGVISTRNYKEMKRQFAENMKFQREQFDYQKELNNKMFNREDNAVQRRMADLGKAGINPLMADGQSASASGGSSTSFTGTDAAQMEMFDTSTMLSAFLDSQRIKNEKALTELERQKVGSQLLNDEETRLTQASNRALNAKTMEERDQAIKESQARIKLINKQAEKLGVDINYQNELLTGEQIKNRIAQIWGIPPGTDPTNNSGKFGLGFLWKIFTSAAAAPKLTEEQKNKLKEIQKEEMKKNKNGENAKRINETIQLLTEQGLMN